MTITFLVGALSDLILVSFLIIDNDFLANAFFLASKLSLLGKALPCPLVRRMLWSLAPIRTLVSALPTLPNVESLVLDCPCPFTFFCCFSCFSSVLRV